MPLFYEGFTQARKAIFDMNEEELIDYIDGLYGRDNLPEDFTIKDLRNEALEQCKKDFTDESSPEYEQVQFYIKLNKVMKKQR